MIHCNAIDSQFHSSSRSLHFLLFLLVLLHHHHHLLLLTNLPSTHKLNSHHKPLLQSLRGREGQLELGSSGDRARREESGDSTARNALSLDQSEADGLANDKQGLRGETRQRVTINHFLCSLFNFNNHSDSSLYLSPATHLLSLVLFANSSIA
jgi:hypothetical protein